MSFIAEGNGTGSGPTPGYQELCNFSLSTLRALIKEEERGSHRLSSLSDLCRLNTGIMEHKECYYFVGETERTVRLDIFGDMQVEQMARHLAMVCQCSPNCYPCY